MNQQIFSEIKERDASGEMKVKYQISTIKLHPGYWETVIFFPSHGSQYVASYKDMEMAMEGHWKTCKEWMMK